MGAEDSGDTIRGISGCLGWALSVWVSHSMTRKLGQEDWVPNILCMLFLLVELLC
jgi:hypothetical protein